MIEVEKDEFYQAIMWLDVVVDVVGEYPYTSIFKRRYSGEIVGKAVGWVPEGKAWPVATRYYLQEELAGGEA